MTAAPQCVCVHVCVQYNVLSIYWKARNKRTCNRVNSSEYSNGKRKGKGSPYSTAERRVPVPIPVLGSQPAGDVSHNPGGRLPLLSARPAVTLATLKRAANNFAAWWTEARWVWTVFLRLCPTVSRLQFEPMLYCTWVQHAKHSATEPSSP